MCTISTYARDCDLVVKLASWSDIFVKQGGRWSDITVKLDQGVSLELSLINESSLVNTNIQALIMSAFT